MNISNLELAQATIEIFAGFVCLMSIVIMAISGKKSAGLKWIKRMFALVSVLFFAETAAYIFRGNTDTLSVAMTKICNFVVFVLNLVLASFFIRYVYSLLRERGGEPKLRYLIIADTFCLGGLLIVVINIFTDWMYYFDSQNYYNRNSMWYAYTAISMLCVVMGCFVAGKYRKVLSKATLIAVLIYGLLPIAAILIQSWFYGIALTNLSIAVGVIYMLIVYLKEWSAEAANEEDEEHKSHTFDSIILFIIMTISMSASIVSCIISIGRITKDNSMRDSEIVAHMVSDTIEKELVKPIIVSKTVTNDYTLQQLLLSGKSAEAIEEDMKNYLDSIRTGFGYQMVYVVSDITDAYYTYDGISKFIDVENDAHDIWYSDFVKSGKMYELNIDTDETNNWSLSVFVNTQIQDDNGKLIGAGGVGVVMEEFEAMLEKYEQEYNITIYLVNADGLIQLASSREKIEVASVDTDYFDKVNNTEFYYEKLSNSSRLTKYIDELDLYIVVEDNQPNKISVTVIVAPAVIIFAIGIIMMAIVFGVISIKERRALEELKNKRLAALTDELTKAFNRRAYEEDCAKLKAKGDYSKTVFVMMDINGLKFVNDNIGHAAGDELIIGAAGCMKKCFKNFGKVYRTGGDEFVAILHVTREQVDRLIADFDYLVGSWSGELVKELAISKGIVVCAEHTDLQLYEMQELADKLMYEDKSAYYVRTGRERRK